MSSWWAILGFLALGCEGADAPTLLAMPPRFEAQVMPLSPDRVAPVLLESDPADGSIGVPLGAPLVLRFSEAMAPGSVETALVLIDPFRGSPIDLVWSADRRTVSAHMVKPFAPGTEVSWMLGSTASDLAGNALAPVEHSYRVVRQRTVALPRVAAMEGSVADDGTWRPELIVGRAQDVTSRVVLDFDLMVLPPALTELVAARLRLELADCTSAPEHPLLAQGIRPGPLGDAFAAPTQACWPEDLPGCLAAPAIASDCQPGWHEVAAQDTLRSAWRARETSNLTAQYRLAFAGDTATDAVGRATVSAAELWVTYLVP